MNRRLTFVCVLATVAVAAGCGTAMRQQDQGPRLRVIGHSSLTGEAAARQAESDKIVCAMEGQRAATEMQARVANMRQQQGSAGSTTQFRGTSSNGYTFRGTAETVPNDSSFLTLGPGLSALQEGERQGRLDALPREAAQMAAMRCLTDRGWQFGYR